MADQTKIKPPRVPSVLGQVLGDDSLTRPEWTVEREGRERTEKYDEYERLLREGGYDQGVYDNLYSQFDRAVTETQDDAIRDVAASYARRGLGSSGLAAGANANVLNQAADDRLAAAERADLSAREIKRNDTLSAMGALTTGNQMELAWKQYYAQLAAQRDAQRAAMWQGIGSLAGTAVGSYVGGLSRGPADPEANGPILLNSYY